MAERAVPAMSESISTRTTRNNSATFETKIRPMMTSSNQFAALRNRKPMSRQPAVFEGRPLAFRPILTGGLVLLLVSYIVILGITKVKVFLEECAEDTEEDCQHRKGTQTQGG
jgi:hypothetical protein